MNPFLTADAPADSEWASRANCKGKAFELFPAGPNSVTLTYWQVRTGPDQSFTKRWTFNVL